MQVVLDAWRTAERRLAELTPDDPERRDIEAEIVVLRAEYQRLFSASLEQVVWPGADVGRSGWAC